MREPEMTNEQFKGCSLLIGAGVVIVFIVFAVLWNAINEARGLDTHVWWSVSRDECVKVDPPDRGTCADLPERYRKIPVQ